jgi:hypothetical protein
VNELKRLLREPLLHFLLAGGLIFLIFRVVSGPAPAPRDTIVVTTARVDQLVAGFEGVWRRQPTAAELRALVDNFVREEIYYREARALGLDRDDAVVRRRMQQKMEFLSDAGSDSLQPDEGELEAYYALHEDRFREPPRLAFEQIFLGQAADSELITAALNSLQANADAPVDSLAWSSPTLLPDRLALSGPNAIDGVFGAGFFAQLETLTPGRWSGPVESGYGVHLVRISEASPGQLPRLDDIRAEVAQEWAAAKSQELREQLYARLRERYRVELPERIMQIESPR